MFINFTGDTNNIIEGICLLKEDLNIETGKEGYLVHLIKRTGGIEVDIQKEKTEIYYEKPCQFYRGLMLLVKQFQFNGSEPIHIIEVPRVNNTGLMLDVSRNAVLTVDSVKHFLRKMALMGMNLLMFYIEDIYHLEGYEHFGYMRGRYNAKELKEIDNYAFLLGIEIMPYIQTLGHMGQILKWDDMKDLRDTNEIILAGEEKTYLFLDRIIETLSSIFRSKRINIGMDEAHELGIGKYFTLHGYRNKMQIMQEHLECMLKITEKYGLTPMIASDMLFNNNDGAADHYEMDNNNNCPINLPKNLDLMYWDYFHTDIELIQKFIRRHKSWGKIPTYLGTVRTWESYATGYDQSFANTKAALEACALECVEEAVISVWLNDGAENSVFSGLPGISYFAQQIYNANENNFEFKKCFHVQTGADFDSFLLLGDLDKIIAIDGKSSGGNPSKFLLWQDILLGFFDFHIREINPSKHYQNLKKNMEKAISKMGPYKLLMEMMRDLCEVLEKKSEIGIKINKAYSLKNIEELNNIAIYILPEISDAIEILRSTHRKYWMETVKPFGWEVLDSRYGGLCARVETSKHRILEYTNGKISAIPELEEERMPYKMNSQLLPVVLCYDQIISSGYQNGPVR